MYGSLTILTAKIKFPAGPLLLKVKVTVFKTSKILQLKTLERGYCPGNVLQEQWTPYYIQSKRYINSCLRTIKYGYYSDDFNKVKKFIGLPD